MPFKVLVTHPNTPQVAFDILRNNGFEVTVNPEEHPTAGDIRKLVPGMDAIFYVSKHGLDKTTIEAAGPQLKMVATMSAGINHIDFAELKRRNILFSNTPDVVSAPTANIAIMLALAAGRRMLDSREQVFNDKWAHGPQWQLGYDLTDSTVGIFGFGGIGQAIAKRVKAFDPKEIIYTGPREKREGAALGATYTTLDDMLARSDFVFLSAPLTETTKFLFNKTLFSKMKPTSVFVNVGRGELVNQDDLIAALKERTIFAAGLDVMYPEPAPKDHILLTLPHCVLIPHLGTATYAARSKMAQLAAENIVNCLMGKPLLTPV